MSDMLDQFFGDAKKYSLTSKEKQDLWASMSLSTREKAECFASIRTHMQRHPIHRHRFSFVDLWQFHKLAASALIALLLIGAGSGGAVYAAEDAMPEDFLYPVKLHVNENVMQMLQRTPEQRAAWEARRIERRLKEAEHIAGSTKLLPLHRNGMRDRIEQRMEHLSSVLDSVPDEQRQNISAHIDEQLQKHEAFLDKLEAGELTKNDMREFKKEIHEVHVKFRKSKRPHWRDG